MGLFFIILQVGFVVYLIYFIFGFLSAAPYVPTKRIVAKHMVELAHIKNGDIVYDLGSGDGRLLKLAKQKGGRVTGFEINPILALWSNIVGVHTLQKNIWKVNLHPADCIFVYLMPWHMDALEKKILQECKKGTIIVSNSFIFPKLKPMRQNTDLHIFVYKV